MAFQKGDTAVIGAQSAGPGPGPEGAAPCEDGGVGKDACAGGDLPSGDPSAWRDEAGSPEVGGEVDGADW